MKIVMTIMTSSGKCASLTNATPCEQVSMCLSAYGDAINRLEKTSGRTKEMSVLWRRSGDCRR